MTRWIRRRDRVNLLRDLKFRLHRPGLPRGVGKLHSEQRQTVSQVARLRGRKIHTYCRPRPEEVSHDDRDAYGVLAHGPFFGTQREGEISTAYPDRGREDGCQLRERNGEFDVDVERGPSAEPVSYLNRGPALEVIVLKDPYLDRTM